MKRINIFLFAFFSIFTTYNAQSQATCASAVSVGSIPYGATGLTTCGSGDDYDSGDACGSLYMGGEDYVFEYTPTAAESINLSLSNTLTWTGILVTEGCPDSGPCVGAGTSSAGNPSVTVDLSAGVTYYFIVSTYPTPDCTPFDISITVNQSSYLGNDACVDNISMNDGEIYYPSNVGSTADLCLGFRFC